MRLRTFQSALGILAVAASLAHAASLTTSFSGHIFGEVRNANGIAQMGATVALYNRYDQEIRHVLTNESGKFVFDTLTPNVYSVRVSLASFVPALRRNISVLAGSENMLKINLASVFSTVELVPSAASSGALMSDDWKWVLRSSPSSRAILHLLPASGTSTSKVSTPLFTGTTAMVRVSAADDGDVTQQGLGTAFALATRVNGAASVHVSGKVGYTTGAGLPAGALRTTYSRDSGRGPEVSLTIRQVYLPAFVGSYDGVEGPAMRSASLSLKDRAQITENILIEYGATLDSAAYLRKVTAVSPYGRISYRLSEASVVRVAFSSGTQPASLTGRPSELALSDLNKDLAALASLPRLSQRGGQLRMETSERWEAGYETVRGSHKVAVAGYSEHIRNGSAMAVGSRGIFNPNEVLRDFDSQNLVVNVGNYQSEGFGAGISQALGEHLDLALSAGRSGALAAQSHVIEAADPSDVLSWLHKADRGWLTARVSATIPKAGTKIATSYGWGDMNTISAQHRYLTTELIDQELGWNASVRQPLPASWGYRKSRMEAGMELRNILSDGYLNLYSGGRRSLLTSSPRSVRGSLSFIF